MTNLGAIDEDVAFDWEKATVLSEELRSTANVLDFQAGERETLRRTARRHWGGRYGDEFNDRVALCVSDASRFVTSMRTAANGLDDLARLAQAEQERRVRARRWLASQDDGGLFGGVPVLGDVIESGQDLLFGGDDVPPPPPPAEPPSIAIGDPGTAVREAAPVHQPSTYGTGGVSSARPDDLDDWVTSSGDLDDVVTRHCSTLVDLHQDFTASLGWGSYDASSLLTAVGTRMTQNQTDGSWVTTIAKAFRGADSGTLANAVIAARLERAGLGAPRAAVTYDEPILWGEAPTSGYSDDPVNTASGNFLEIEADLPAGGLCRLLPFARSYNSGSDRVGAFDRGWASLVSCRLRAEPDGAHWVGPNGQEAVIPRLDGDGQTDRAVRYARMAGIGGLVIAEAAGLAIEVFGGGRMAFDATGLRGWTPAPAPA